MTCFFEYDLYIIARDHRQMPITEWNVCLVHFPETPPVASIRKADGQFILEGVSKSRAFPTLHDAADQAQLEMDKLSSAMAVN